MQPKARNDDQASAAMGERMDGDGKGMDGNGKGMDDGDGNVKVEWKGNADETPGTATSTAFNHDHTSLASSRDVIVLSDTDDSDGGQVTNERPERPILTQHQASTSSPSQAPVASVDAHIPNTLRGTFNPFPSITIPATGLRTPSPPPSRQRQCRKGKERMRMGNASTSTLDQPATHE